MLALIRISVSPILYGWIILYRTGAGCCSIIGVWAYQSLMFNNRQQSCAFFMS